MDPTNINDLGPVATAADNPSNGLDINSLLGQLIGTAGNSYIATQNSGAAIAASQAQYAAYAGQPSNPLAILSTSSGKSWLIIGAGILALALILRH